MLLIQFDSNRVPLQLFRNDTCRSRAYERIKHPVTRLGEQLDEPFRQGGRERCAVALVTALARQMQDVGRIDHISPNPVRDVLPESATDFRVVPDLVRLAQVLEPALCPVSDRRHHSVLVHSEPLCLVELKQTLPRIPESVGPFPRMAILLVPDKFFCPEPALSPHLHYQFHHVGVALTVCNLLLDVQDESPGRFQHAQQFAGDWQEPRHIMVGLYATVGADTLVGIWR